MFIIVALEIILAVMLDFFFVPGIFFSYELHFGFVLLFLLTRHSNISVLAPALLYGFLMDLLSITVPFGTFLVSHFVVALLLIQYKDMFSGVPKNFVIIMAFVSSALYAIIIGLAQYAVQLVSSINVTLVALISPSKIAISSFMISVIIISISYAGSLL